MVNLSIKIKNSEQIKRTFKQAPEKFIVGFQKAIQSTGTFVVGEVKQHITAGTSMWKRPIDTGQMRQGMHVNFQKMKAIIKPSTVTPYAQFVHEGTRFMRKRPFFEITAEESKNRIGNFMNNMLDGIVKDIFGKI